MGFSLPIEPGWVTVKSVADGNGMNNSKMYTHAINVFYSALGIRKDYAGRIVIREERVQDLLRMEREYQEKRQAK